ncbi:MAG: S8 family serine peptidase [Prolixibacteraceae bacterium]|jgi:hypothetical protein
MKIRLILLLLFLCADLGLYAQDSAKNSYWVKLKDKSGTPFRIGRPDEFLSQRSIARRIRQHIAIDETDLPVSPEYVDSLRNLGLEIVHTSKWLNGVTVRTADTVLINQIATLSFVVSVELTKPGNLLKSATQKFRIEDADSEYKAADYGIAISQLTLMNGQYLHEQGYRGKGIQIAVLDAGFWHVDRLSVFDSLRTENRILGTRDFVDPTSGFYEQHTHGMSVLSCMGGNLPGSMIGTAPDASFYLFRTEDASTEYPVEEDNWVTAAEFADSLGVDVINSSLGYFTFDDVRMNHTYTEMDGKTIRVTQGANMAFQKGILVFASAGNEASDSWKYIIAPADGENILAVAAVDKNGNRASFSSVGPAFGGAVKPNVAAVGWATYLETSAGALGYSNGTSFSSPVLAGMGACLLQANPLADVQQLKMAIEQSASQYSTPDSLLGFGIPDFEKADQYLKIRNLDALENGNTFVASPNPFQNYLFVQNLNPVSGIDGLLSIYNLQGVQLWQSTFKTSDPVFWENLSNLPRGFLVLKIESEGKKEVIKLVKTN